MEAEVEELLRSSQPSQPIKGTFIPFQSSKDILLIPHSSHSLEESSTVDGVHNRINIEEMYTKVRTALDEGERVDGDAEQTREQFWREMDQNEDHFETIARFFSKAVIE